MRDTLHEAVGEDFADDIPSSSVNVIEQQPYRDYGCETDDGVVKNAGTPKESGKFVRARGGVTEPFPTKLHKMLEAVEEEGNSSIVSWLSHGRAFLVHKPNEFVETVMPRFFRQTKMASFNRQLNLYGFHRISLGQDGGAYYHECFLRGKEFLCRRMIRTKVKGRGHSAAYSPCSEPNFYVMPPIQSGNLKLDRPPSPSLSQSVEKKSTDQSLLPQVAAAKFDQSPRSTVQPYEPPALTSSDEEPKDIVTSTTEGTDHVITFEGKCFHYLDSSCLNFPYL